MGPLSANVPLGAIAVDLSSNVYMVGSVNTGVDGNTLIGTHDFFVTKYDSAGTTLWTKQSGVASRDTYGQAVATDSSGNVYVTGYTTGALDGNSMMGYADCFITKYNSSGTKLWTRQFGSMFTNGQALVTDTFGNIFVSGYATGGLDGNTLTGDFDYFVAKYDSTGTKIWIRQSGVASKETDGQSVATDSSGDVFVAGYTNGGLDGNTLAGTRDFFVAKYNSAGNKLWTRQLGVASKYTDGKGVATDSSGNVFVTGSTEGGLDGNPQPDVGRGSCFITKYNSMGTKQWTRQANVASAYTDGHAIATDSSGNIFVAGNINIDFFVTKYDSSGTSQWTIQHAASDTYPSSVAIDSSAHVYVSGWVEGTGIDGLSPIGQYDAFVSKY